jgi:hypothetical protein
MVNCTVEASGGEGGAGIGAGSGELGGSSRIRNLSISCCVLKVASTSGCLIGSGLRGSEVVLLRFTGSSFIEIEVGSAIGTLGASSLLIMGGSVVCVAEGGALLTAIPRLVSCGIEQSADLLIGYRNVIRNGSDSVLSFLRVDSSGAHGLAFCISAPGFDGCFEDSQEDVRGVVFGGRAGNHCGYCEVPYVWTYLSNWTRSALLSRDAFVRFLVRPSAVSGMEDHSLSSVVAGLVECFDLCESDDCGFAPPIIGSLGGHCPAANVSFESDLSLMDDPYRGRVDWAERIGCNRSACQGAYDYFLRSRSSLIGFLRNSRIRASEHAILDGTADLDLLSDLMDQVEWRRFCDFYDPYVLSSDMILFNCTSGCDGDQIRSPGSMTGTSDSTTY